MKIQQCEKIRKKSSSMHNGFTLIEVVVSASLSFICILIFVQISEPIKNALQMKIHKIEDYDSLIHFTNTMDTYAKNSSEVSTSTVSKIQVESNNYEGEIGEQIIEDVLALEFDSNLDLLIFKKIDQSSMGSNQKIWAICGLQKTSNHNSAALQQKFICNYPHNMKSTGLDLPSITPIEMLKMYPIKNTTAAISPPYVFSIFPGSKIVQMKIEDQYIIQFGFISHINLIQ